MADAKTATKEHEHAAQHQSQPEAQPPAPVVAAAPSQAPVIAAPAAAPVLAAQALKPLNEMRFYGPGEKQNIWMAYPERGTKIGDLFERGYWAHVARKLRDGDKICMLAEDRSYYVEGIVFMADQNWAFVRQHGDPIFLEKTAMPTPESDYEIQDGGLQDRWCVIEKKTGRIIKGDGTLQTRFAAEAWLRSWLQATRNPRAA